MHHAPRILSASVQPHSRRKLKTIVTAIVVALSATSFVVADVVGSEAEAGSSDCWDEYTLKGTVIQRIVTPIGVQVGACTVPTSCLDGYSGTVKNRLYVPRGLPRSSCTTTSPTTTTQPPATTQPPTTTTQPPATTQPPTTTTQPPATTQAPTTTTQPPATTQPPTTTQPPAGTFLATFDTAADFYSRFDTHTGNYCTDNQPPNCRPEDLPPGWADIEFPGSHNAACQAPPSNRTVNITNHANLFWWCAPGGASTGHLMSGLNTAGYSLVSFTPKQSFVGVTEICWDQSLADLGGGKWNNVVLVPEATYLSHPNLNPRRVQEGEGPYRLDYVTPDFITQGGPGDFNIQDLGTGAGALVGVKQFRGTTQIYRGGAQLVHDSNSWTADADESTRFRHCFRDNRNGTLTYTQQRPAGLHTVTTNGSFPAGTVRVLFQDDTYDADKHGGTGRYTWHWDNISIR